MVFCKIRTPKENEKLKFWYMRMHKSFGLLMGISVIPRILFRMNSRIPAPPAGPEIL